MTRRVTRIVVIVVWFGSASPPCSATWSFDAAIIGFWQDDAEGAGSFRAQRNLASGVELHELRVVGQDLSIPVDRFELTASGIGSSSPVEQVDLKLLGAGPWEGTVNYTGVELAFDLNNADVSARRQRQVTDRWRGRFDWRGWERFDLRLEARRYRSSSHREQPRYLLNERYPVGVDSHNDGHSIGYRIKTKRLPITVEWAQRWGHSTRRSAWRPLSVPPLDGVDPDLLLEVDRQRRDEVEVPQSRLTLSAAGAGWSLIANAMHQNGSLDGDGTQSTTFGIGGGDAGNLRFVDVSRFASDVHIALGSIDVTKQLRPGWRLRLRAAGRDQDQDAVLASSNLIRARNPLGGVFDLFTTFDDETRVNVNDRELRVTSAWSGSRGRVWTSVFSSSRDIRWTMGDQIDDHRGRDGFGYGIGGQWDMGALSARAEYETNRLDSFLYRIDPRGVDRVKLTARVNLDSRLNITARLARSSSNRSVPELNRESWSGGATASWTSVEGSRGGAVSLDWIDFDQVTGLIMPGGGVGNSRYETRVLDLGALAWMEREGRTISARVSRFRDRGDTWPLRGITASASVELRLSATWSLLGQLQYWQYDESKAESDDFDVLRLGIGVRWSP